MAPRAPAVDLSYMDRVRLRTPAVPVVPVIPARPVVERTPTPEPVRMVVPPKLWAPPVRVRRSTFHRRADNAQRWLDEQAAKTNGGAACGPGEPLDPPF